MTLNCKGCPTAMGETFDTQAVTLRAASKCLITDVNVLLGIDSQYFSDITASVKGPNGEGPLFSRICNSSAQTMSVTFDDDATASITTACGQNPISGTYKTQSGSGLTGLDGKPAAGDWKIGITDAFPGFGDMQSVTNFSITVTTAEPQ